MIKNKEKILVAMSGGVDSSAAAALLVRAGYDVTGAFMVNYDENGCWHADYQDALRVAAKLKIPLIRLNFVKEYKKLVLDYMYQEYKLGRTPNPDVMCNKFIKFGVWLKEAKKLGYNKLATGHYATLSRKFTKNKDYSVHLMQAKDQNKDQTYFLHQLKQDQLEDILFPIGIYTKPEVRLIAKKSDLPTAEKEESMGICFVGEVPMKDFLQKEIKVKKGDIVLTNGTKIGEHDGLAFYTIGQRNFGERVKKGEGQENSKPLFVVDKNVKKNLLIVGEENDPLLYKNEIIVKNINWISGQVPKMSLKCLVRLRHRQPLQKATIIIDNKKNKQSGLLVKFAEPERAITPGQFVVFYKDGECLGGGVV